MLHVLIVSLNGSCSIIFSLFCNHLTHSWPHSDVDRICPGCILVIVQFLPVPNCVCATQVWHMQVCMPGFNLRSCDIIDHKTACSLHHCQCPVCHPHLSPVISSCAGDSHGISRREDSLCWSPPALCLWNDWLYLSPSSPLQCVGSVAKTSIRVWLPRISLRACACIMNMKFAFNKALEQ